MRKILIFSLISIFLLYLGICAFTFFLQRKLIYFPSHDGEFFVLLKKIDLTEIWLKSRENKINAWYKPPVGKKPVILFFHGNGGNLSYRADKLNILTETGWGILAIDYPGYGKSSGMPTEENIYQAGREALEWLHQKGFKPKDLILYGESLGSGVAIELGQSVKFRAIILEAPFSSLINMGKQKYPFLPVKLLLKDKYDSINKINNIISPVFIFHGAKDLIAPPGESLKLFNRLNSTNKSRVLFPNKKHDDIDIKTIKIFIEKN